MNAAHWHLLLNHVPIMGTIGATGILITGFIFKNPAIKRTALGIFIVSGLIAIPAYLTGEGAEDVVENLPGVTENFIETHEDLGKIFLALTGLLGLLALVNFALDRMQHKVASHLYLTILVIGLGSSIFAKQVATSGGEIRHTEIRANGVAQEQQPTEKTADGKDDD